MLIYEKELTFAKNLALKAGKIILENFGLSYDSKIKQDTSPVTIVDEKINRLVIEEVNQHFPTHSVLGEEQNSITDSKYVWICDPIDGTIPFTMGVPVSVFALALVIEGNPVLGVVQDPYTERLYTAVHQQGAFLNNQQIRVNNSGLNSKSRINFDWWPQAEYKIYEPIFDLCVRTGAYIFSPGSTIQAGVLVARGQFTASIFSGTTGKFVDIAPLKVIVEEAGGTVTDLFGNQQRYDQDIKGAIVSNGIIHQEIVDALSQSLL